VKLISFTIPSYNSEAYLHHAVDTILSGGEEVEILIINDGSKDGTAQIADKYAQEYPSIVRAIHKENGGHGSGVNRGVAEAKGLFFKVVDSDDWVDQKALRDLLDIIREHVTKGIEPDVYFTNFIYDHTQDNTKFVRHYRKKFPVDRFFDWSEAKNFYTSQLLLMHAIMYKTEILRKSQTILPEHTFYVDNYFAYKPLPYCKKLYYCDLDLYHYFIGRADQSVTVKNMTARYAQQIRVMKCIFDSYSYDEIMGMEKGLRNYMLHTVSAICMNTLMFCCSGGDEPERKEAYREFWEHTLNKDPKLHKHLRTKGLPVTVCWMPWKLRGWSMFVGYKVLCKVNKLG
jgi:glycosyltransferase involved in cell wall biosynthesis